MKTTSYILLILATTLLLYTSPVDGELHLQSQIHLQQLYSPVGYRYIIYTNISGELEGYIDRDGIYHPLKTYIQMGEQVITPTEITKLYIDGKEYEAVIVDKQDIQPAIYTDNLDGDTVILKTTGELYYSRLLITYEPDGVGDTYISQGTINRIVNETPIVFIYTDTVIEINETGQRRIPLHKYIGVGRGCISKIDRDNYIYGVSDTPPCRGEYTPLHKIEYRGASYIVSLQLPNNDIVILGYYGLDKLIDAELLGRYETGIYTHVIYTEQQNIHYYIEKDGDIEPLEKKNAYIHNAETCQIPLGATIYTEILWNNNDKLEPLETIIYSYGGETYICIYEPDIYAPATNEIIHTVYMELPEPYRTLYPAITSTGRYYQPNQYIPVEILRRETVYILTGEGLARLNYQERTILTNPTTAFIIITLGIVVYIVVKRERKPYKDTITLILDILDIKDESRYTEATPQEMRREAEKHLEKYGYYPTYQELAQEHKILPKLPPKMNDIEEVYTPHRYTELETQLRKLVKLYISAGYEVRRYRDTLIISTKYGDKRYILHIGILGKPTRQNIQRLLKNMVRHTPTSIYPSKEASTRIVAFIVEGGIYGDLTKTLEQYTDIYEANLLISEINRITGEGGKAVIIGHKTLYILVRDTVKTISLEIAEYKRKLRRL